MYFIELRDSHRSTIVLASESLVGSRSRATMECVSKWYPDVFLHSCQLQIVNRSPTLSIWADLRTKGPRVIHPSTKTLQSWRHSLSRMTKHCLMMVSHDVCLCYWISSGSPYAYVLNKSFKCTRGIEYSSTQVKTQKRVYKDSHWIAWKAIYDMSWSFPFHWVSQNISSKHEKPERATRDCRPLGLSHICSTARIRRPYDLWIYRNVRRPQSFWGGLRVALRRMAIFYRP